MRGRAGVWVGALVAAVATAGGCGGSEDGSGARAAAEVECTPGTAAGPQFEIAAHWAVGDRFSFRGEFSKVDSEEKDENFDATREGEFVVAAKRGSGYRVEWRMEELLSVALGNVPPEKFQETFGEGGPERVVFGASRAGAFTALLNAQELQAGAKAMVDDAIERSGEELDPAQASAIRDLISSEGLVHTKFIEKATEMQYAYGLEVDSGAASTSSTRVASPFADSPLPAKETVEVSDPKTQGGCVEVRIARRPEPASLRKAVGEIGSQLGTFDPAEAATLELKDTQTVTYDRGAGLIRRVELVREGRLGRRTVTVRDIFVIEPGEK